VSAVTKAVLLEVQHERERQDAKWGEQNHPSFGPLPPVFVTADLARSMCEANHEAGFGSFADILLEEVAEAYEEQDDEAKLREELVQVAAVAVNWIEAIDRRAS
jgi:hypothetical protein